MRLLITGSAGFAGSHLVDHFLENTNWQIIGLDSFKHRGDAIRVQNNPRYKIYGMDLSKPISARIASEIGPVDYIINAAAESHVDRSITDPVPFIENNVSLAINMLEYARTQSLKMFFQISTDEVYGAAPEGVKHQEWCPIIPSNPYAASKAAQEAIAISYWRTYSVPVVITNCFSMDTRMLTKNGPKNFYEITEKDQVWTLDENENLILTEVIEKIKMPGPKEMIFFDTNKVNQLVTPNHRMMIRRRDGRNSKYGPIEECLAENLLDEKQRIRIPTTGNWTGSDLPDKYKIEGASSKAMMAIYGWFVSEGYLTTGNGICFGAGTEKQKEILTELLSLIGNPYINGRSVRVTNAKLYGILKEFGHLAKNKVVPDFIKALNKELLKIFLDAAIDGDGSRYRTREVWATVYYTKSIKLAYDMAEIGMKCGFASRVCSRYTFNPSKTKKAESFIVRFRENCADIERPNITIHENQDDVWCIKTKTGRVFVERNGIISLSGQTMNMYGQRQDQEKFIPMTIKKIEAGETVPIHGTKEYIGKRHYLHSRNHADAILWLMTNTVAQTYQDNPHSVIVPDRYNIVGDVELDNLELAKMIAEILGKPLNYELIDFHSARPGHDRRYALDGNKIKQMGWVAPVTFYKSLENTVKWTLENKAWLK